MLSKRDIEKELGKGINIYPVIRDNFKENSINLTASANAWTQTNATVYWYGGESFGLEDKHVKKGTKNFRHGSKCMRPCRKPPKASRNTASSSPRWHGHGRTAVMSCSQATAANTPASWQD